MGEGELGKVCWMKGYKLVEMTKRGKLLFNETLHCRFRISFNPIKKPKGRWK